MRRLERAGRRVSRQSRWQSPRLLPAPPTGAVSTVRVRSRRSGRRMSRRNSFMRSCTMRPSRMCTATSAIAAASALWVAITTAAPNSSAARRSSREPGRRWRCRDCRWARRRPGWRGLHQRPGDSDPLHLPAGELVGQAPVLSSRPTQRRRSRAVLARILRAGQQQRQFHVFERRERGQQLEELKNEANFVPAQSRSDRRRRDRQYPARQRTSPVVGKSIAPQRFSRVVLPQPLRPSRAVTWPAAQSSETPRRASTPPG